MFSGDALSPFGVLPPAPAKESDDAAWWGYTSALEAYLLKRAGRGYFEEHSRDINGEVRLTFEGRPVIRRDSKIRGGVYLVERNGEACVVDDKKDQFLIATYGTLLEIRRKAERNGASKNQYLLEDVWRLVLDKMPYSIAREEEIISQYGHNTKVVLGMYEGGGVCRHQALLGAYLIERLIEEGYLTGRVSVDRNIVPGKGGHAWIRYTNSENEIIIIDPAQEFLGYLADVDDPYDKWFYARPEDKKGRMVSDQEAQLSQRKKGWWKRIRGIFGRPEQPMSDLEN